MPANPYSAPKARPAGEVHGTGAKLVAVLARAIGALISCAALLGLVVALLALLDPPGAQLANDSDPLGTPSAPDELWFQLAIWLVLLCVGLWLLLRRRSR